jgi:hypothetical protein
MKPKLFLKMYNSVHSGLLNNDLHILEEREIPCNESVLELFRNLRRYLEVYIAEKLEIFEAQQWFVHAEVSSESPDWVRYFWKGV